MERDRFIMTGQDGNPKAPLNQTETEVTQFANDDDVPNSSGHKRSLSGSILSRFNFLRSPSDAKSSSSTSGIPLAKGTGSAAGSSSVQPDVDTTPSTAPKYAVSLSRKMRSRRGSLRKTALLGGGKMRTDKEKRLQTQDTSNLHNLDIPQVSSSFSSGADDSPIPPSPDSDDYPTPRPSLENRALLAGATKPMHSLASNHQEKSTSEESLPLPTISRRSTLGDMSTTDDDDPSRASSQRLQAQQTTPSLALKKLGSDNYFPTENSLQRRRSSNRARSPLAALPIEPVSTPEEWDYSETEWWGWVILIITWIVFVMGMGSCFEVWSWAWDVGETPYAPPELEDDPTLPIVGYYPALIILTGVMAWVWVVVAWVGMKYFRHAKISGDV
jgi:hypothetical protein